MENHKKKPACVKCDYSGRRKTVGSCLRNVKTETVLGVQVSMRPAQWYERSDRGSCGPNALHFKPRFQGAP